MPFLALLSSPLVRYALAFAGVMALLGGLYGLGHHNGALGERGHWEALIADQKAAAAKLIADRVAENAAKEAQSEALNVKLSKEVADAHAETVSALDAYNRAIRLRSQGGGTCRSPAGTAQATGAGSNPQLEAPGIFVSVDALHDLGNLAAAADDLTAVMSACKAWAMSNGR